MSQATRTVTVVPVQSGPFWACVVLSQSGKEIERSAPRFETPEAASFWGTAVWRDEQGVPVRYMTEDEARKEFPYGFCA